MSLSRLREFLSSIIAKASKYSDSLRLLIGNPSFAYYFTLMLNNLSEEELKEIDYINNIIRNVNVANYIRRLKQSEYEAAINALLGSISVPAAKKELEKYITEEQPEGEEEDVLSE